MSKIKIITLNQWLKYFGDQKHEKEERTEYVSESIIYDAFSIVNYIPQCFVEVEDWADDVFRRVWISEYYLTLICYIQATVYTEVHKNVKSYKLGLSVGKLFYDPVILVS